MAGNMQRSASQNGQPATTDVEVKKPGGKRYSRAYKLEILAAADRCGRGELGALLRREGLYHSTLSKWRVQRAAGKLDGRYQKEKAAAQAETAELKRLQRENNRLKKELEKAEAIIALQKKVANLLDTLNE